MGFEFEPHHRDVSADEVRDDIRRVAAELGKSTLSIAEYRVRGRFSPATARRRFGSWFDALAHAGLERTHNIAVSAEECIADLKRVAAARGEAGIKMRDYEANGRYSVRPFLRHFGSWSGALAAANLKPLRPPRASDEDYFGDLEQVWASLGRQPRRAEMGAPLSQFSAGAYERRFGTWGNALSAFRSYLDREQPVTTHCVETDRSVSAAAPAPAAAAPSHSTSRGVNDRLRFLVMRRDDFKCCACGNSPALQPGLVLHVDHVRPWSKGGETVIDNLQTLCEACNLGKGDLQMRAPGEG